MKAHLSRGDLPILLDELAEAIEVIAPVDVEGTAMFKTWKGQGLALGANTFTSPVEYLLPKREVLFRYVQFSGRYTFKDSLVEPRVLFGVRPCDLKAISVLDRIFGADPPDQAYLERRRSTVVLAHNCTVPGDGCFCAQMGSGPGCDDGFDLLLTELKSGYLVESGSPAGILILGEHSHLFGGATPEMAEEKLERMAASELRVRANVKTTPEGIKGSMEAADWEELGRHCLQCGGCSFVCPTCHCFNVLDLGVPDGERVRCADSCVLSGFSRMTSGANPRPTPGSRLMNWYMDKFEYIPLNTGMLGCVGCGRCDRVCMAQMDRQNLKVI